MVWFCYTVAVVTQCVKKTIITIINVCSDNDMDKLRPTFLSIEVLSEAKP